MENSPLISVIKWQTWRVALSGMLALATAMGIGRFAFAPLLPMMLHDGIVDLNAGGWLATANYVGYFVGALVCMVLRGNPVHFIRVGLISTALLTLGMGVSKTLWLLLLLRGLGGVASALVLVFASGWCLQRLVQLGAPTLGGIVFSGPGIGVVITGIPVGMMVAHGWSSHRGWLLFALMAVVIIAGIWTTFSGGLTTPGLQAAGVVQEESPQFKQQVRGLVLGYGIAGFGYIITATFLPVIARLALPGSHWTEFFWPLFGLCMALGALLATRIPAHTNNFFVLSLCYVVQAAGVVSGILWPNVGGFVLCSVLVGLPFAVIVFFAMRDARRLRGEHASRLMGLLTAVYGIGQIAGPPLATSLVHQTGSFTASLLLAATTLLAGSGLFAFMSRQSRTALLALS